MRLVIKRSTKKGISRGAAAAIGKGGLSGRESQEPVLIFEWDGDEYATRNDSLYAISSLQCV